MEEERKLTNLSSLWLYKNIPLVVFILKTVFSELWAWQHQQHLYCLHAHVIS
jgi:hypothetical protein